MSGTKRYENKSGGYYLQNSVKFLRNNKNPLNQKAFTKPNLNNNKNNKNLIRVNRKLLFDELVPLPKMKQKNKLKCDYEQKNLNNAVNNAKYIRRYQYSKNLEKKQILKNKENKKNEKLFLSKIKYIQIWWKTIFQIIKIQKFIRGALYRIKLVKIIQNQKRYFGKILNFVIKIKKIFWKKFLINQRPYIKYYFKKWKEKISKKIIIEELRKYLIKKEFKETKYNSDKNNKNSRSNNDLNKEVNKINLKKKDININNSLFDLYNVCFFNRNSSQPFLTIKNKNDNNKRNMISLGLEGSFSSKFIQKNNNDKELNKKANKAKQLLDKNKIENNNNKRNNNDLFKPMKTFSENGVKQNYNNININLGDSQSKKSFKSHLLIEKNKDKLTTKKSKKNENIKNNLKQHKKENSKKFADILNKNYKFKNKSKIKKNKVYQNELFLYNNKYQTIITTNEKNFFSENNDLEESSDSDLNESQFNELLNNSTLKDNPTIFINYEEENKNNIFKENKEKNNFENNLLLKKYFQKWINKYIIKKFIEKSKIIKRINCGKNILNAFYNNKYCKLFFRSIKLAYTKIKAFEKLKEIFDNFIRKIFVQNIISFRNQYHLYEYFNKYKYKIYSRIILEKLKKFLLSQKERKERLRSKDNIYQNYYYLNGQNTNNIPISDDFINKNLNLSSNQANNCFIINNLNYNNNTNNIDIRLSYDNDNNNLRNIHSQIIELTKKNFKQNKPNIGLYKRNNNILFQKINNGTMNPNQDINIFSHNHLFIKSNNNNNNNSQLNKEKDNNKLHSNLFPNEVHLNKSLVLSKYSNRLNWNLMTKKNQLMMIINIIERQRKLKELKLLNKAFEIWKNDLKNNKYKNIISFNVTLNHFLPNYINNSINSDNNVGHIRNLKSSINKDIIRLNTYSKKNNLLKNTSNENGSNKFAINNINDEKKKMDNINLKLPSLYHEFSQEVNKHYTYSVHDLSDFRMENINKNSVYIRKKAITGSFNNRKKNKTNDFKDLNLTNNEYNIYKRKYENTSPENYFEYKKYDKIEEMEISFGDLNKNKNKTNPAEQKKNNKYNNEKFVKPFNVFETSQNNYNENNNGVKNIIIEDIEENNELVGDKENFILNLYSYFEGNEKEFYFNTFNEFRNPNFSKEINKKSEIKKSKSAKYLF